MNSNKCKLNELLKNNNIRVSNKLYKNKDFTLEEILFLSHLIMSKNNDKKCYYSYKKWAEVLRCSESKVRRLAKKLKEKNYITWETGNSKKTNRYILTDKVNELLNK